MLLLLAAALTLAEADREETDASTVFKLGLTTSFDCFKEAQFPARIPLSTSPWPPIALLMT